MFVGRNDVWVGSDSQEEHVELHDEYQHVEQMACDTILVPL